MNSTPSGIVVPAVPRPGRLMETIVDQLAQLIGEGILPSGTVLRQEELARQFGVSRTPLREALLQLERDGLIRYSRNGTAEVAQIDKQEALELNDIREMIDRLAARYAAKRGLPNDLANQMVQNIDAMAAAARAHDKHLYLQNNLEFHLAVLDASQHNRLNQFRSTVRVTARIVALYPEVEGGWERLESSSAEHLAILDAIRARDAEEAEERAGRHIREAVRHWLGADDSLGADGTRAR